MRALTKIVTTCTVSAARTEITAHATEGTRVMSPIWAFMAKGRGRKASHNNESDSLKSLLITHHEERMTIRGSMAMIAAPAAGYPKNWSRNDAT